MSCDKNKTAANDFEDETHAGDFAKVLVRSKSSTEFILYLNGSIRANSDFYMNHYAVLQQATEDDLVSIHINSPGGSLATGMQYLDHMRHCRAPIKVSVGMECASMASAIALEADGWEVTSMSTMLVHGFSYGAMGSESHVYNQAKFNNRLNERWLRETYTGFLTEEEIQDCLRGVDVLLDSDQLNERFEALIEIRREQMEALFGGADDVQVRNKTLDDVFGAE